MVIPPAPGIKREVTEHILTDELGYHGGRTVRAQYILEDKYKDPFYAPVYALMTVNPATGIWYGRTVLQAFASTEPVAISNLLETLTAVAAPISPEEWAAAAAIARAMSVVLPTDPWETQPFPRPKKKRRHCHQWRDASGKQIRVYLDEFGPRNHADPNCSCATCSLLRGRKPPDEKQ